MALITDKTEPRPSFLYAVFFTGIALLLAAGKGYLPPVVGEVGNWLMIGSIAWQLARWWYLRNDKRIET